MPTLPTAPCFTDQGQIEFQGALGMNHVEGQVSVSPFNHFGVSYGGFWSDKRSNGYYFAGHGYTAINKTKTLYLQGNVGFETAGISNGYSEGPFIGQYRYTYKASSNYELYKFGAGLYWEQSRYFTLSLDMRYTHANFYRLGLMEEKKVGTAFHSFYTWENTAPAVIPIYTPSLTGKFTLYYFLIKYSLLYNIYPATNVSYTKMGKPEMRNGQIYRPSYPDTRVLNIDRFVFMASVGFDLDWKQW